MLMAAAVPAGADPLLTIVQHGADGDQVVGTATLDAAGLLHIVSAVPAQADRLRQLATRVNAYPALSVDAPPPPGSAPFRNVSRPVGRADPGFADALRGFLRTYYDIELR